MSEDPIRFPYRNELRLPVIGLEAEFQTFVDDEPVTPEEYWRTPSAFIERPLLQRSTKSSQLPAGGALYFDGGVVEVVTPVIEIAPQCTGRAVRSLWEQITFVRDHLDRWERKNGRRVRLAGYSCHFNISFELGREERGRNRTIQKLALLLATILPVPVLVAGANRRSSGVGVRPRRDRIEITFDFIPDPGLMAAATALIVGVARAVIAWPSYRVDELQTRGIPTLAGVAPGKHATRSGWVTRGFHFPRDPMATPIDEPVWATNDGRTVSLRALGREIAMHFRDSISLHSDAFGLRILFATLEGSSPSLLELDDRPAQYDDIGREIRWGTTLPQLQNFAAAMDNGSGDAPSRRRSDLEVRLEPPWRGETKDRRERLALPPKIERRTADDRRAGAAPTVERLTRSAYEQVFRNVGAGKRLELEGDILEPVGVRGWYHVVFRDQEGIERLLSIDQLLEAGGRWRR